MSCHCEETRNNRRQSSVTRKPKKLSFVRCLYFFFCARSLALPPVSFYFVRAFASFSERLRSAQEEEAVNIANLKLFGLFFVYLGDFFSSFANFFRRLICWLMFAGGSPQLLLTGLRHVDGRKEKETSRGKSGHCLLTFPHRLCVKFLH